MKPIYKSLVLEHALLAVTLSLQAEILNNGTSSSQAVSAEALEGLKVKLVSPGVSGARDLIASGECALDGENLVINLDFANMSKGVHRICVVMEYGTNTVVLYGLDIIVTMYGNLAADTQEYEDDVTVVSTIGDGQGTPFDPSEMQAQIAQLQLDMAGKADGSIYRVGESGDPAVQDVAKVYGHSVELSSAAQATGLYAVAEGESKATGNYAHAEGKNFLVPGPPPAYNIASGEASHTEGEGTTASGANSHAEGFCTTASSDSSHAEGSATTASGAYSHAEGQGTTASGVSSHAEGNGTIASQDNQHVSGTFNVEDTNGDYAFIVGNGTDANNRSNAFAIDWNGNLVLFNAGTPVVLTPAKLAQLIA